MLVISLSTNKIDNIYMIWTNVIDETMTNDLITNHHKSALCPHVRAWQFKSSFSTHFAFTIHPRWQTSVTGDHLSPGATARCLPGPGLSKTVCRVAVVLYTVVGWTQAQAPGSAIQIKMYDSEFTQWWGSFCLQVAVVRLQRERWRQAVIRKNHLSLILHQTFYYSCFLSFIF